MKASKVIVSLLIWPADCTQFLSENRLHGCHIFLDGMDILYPIPKRILDICTALLSVTTDITQGYMVQLDVGQTWAFIVPDAKLIIVSL